MAIEKKDLQKYSELLLKSGVNLQRRQNLHIRYNLDAGEFARLCAQNAYKMGALNVTFQWEDNTTLKARIDAQTKDQEALKAIPGWLKRQHKTIVDEQWAMLSINSYEDVDIMKNVNQDALSIYEINRMKYLETFRNAVLSHKIPWCVAAFPSNKWANRVLGDNADMDDLWSILRPILRLESPDPCHAWKKQAALLQKRSQKLNSLKMEFLQFTGGLTNLKIGLNRKSRWVGGGEQSGDKMTMPNLPTEEVFTTPNRLKCEGMVRVSRPVQVRGTVVKEIIFYFKEGIVVDFQASEGRDVLAAFLSSDPGARRLGEVALVSQDSPIAQCGYFFDSILIDENASCHIALGAGYNSGLFGGEKLNSAKRKEAAGCNHSMVHTDFMIGSEELSVIGVDFNGKKTTIIKDGNFILV